MATFKLHRINKTDDFSSVFAFCKVRKGNYLKLYIKKNDYQYPRLGIIVSKKIINKSYLRNYVKRIVKELFMIAIPVLDNYDIIVRVVTLFERGDFLKVKFEFNDLISEFYKNDIK